MSRKTKLAICTDGIFPYAIGGMQRHSRFLIDYLSKNQDYEIIVLHPHNETIFNHPNVQEIKIQEIDKNKNYLLQSYLYSKRIYNVLFATNPERKDCC